MKILVETSARHVHVTDADLKVLFGENAVLTVKKELSQPGQFASEQRVNVIGPKKTLANVSILGPTRNATQIEVSLTDARTLGVSAPVRESGDVEGSAPCVLEGPCGKIELTQGVIVAKRHLHCTPEDAATLGVKDKDVISIKCDSAERSLIFGDVVVRVSPKFATAVHLDTDEANAAGLSGVVYCEIVK